jgi:hypothetical protein
MLSDYIMLPNPFGTPLAINYLLALKRQSFRIAINTAMGTPGAAVNGYVRPFVGSMIIFGF